MTYYSGLRLASLTSGVLSPDRRFAWPTAIVAVFRA
jgi:hypothetical protein